MGCKCANSNEEEDEIQKNALEDGNAENEYNKDFNQHEDLLGLNNQDNLLYKEDIQNNQFNQREPNNENENMNKYVNENEIENNNNINNNDPNAKYADYPQKIVELINYIREDPVGYADIIEGSINNIIEEEDKNDPANVRLIFKKKVKVALNKGEPAFREAAEHLRSLNPLPPLEFSTEKCIPLPENEEELKDPTFLREQVRQIREETQIDVFFKDLIKVPEVSGLLMIVDDTNKNAGKKRMALLNKDLKYVGVTSKFIGKTFIAYFAFSK
jgi:hypothetical protein